MVGEVIVTATRREFFSYDLLYLFVSLSFSLLYFDDCLLYVNDYVYCALMIVYCIMMIMSVY